MFTNLYNQKLYAFDPLIDNKTGALNITASRIEFNPVERISVSPFKFPLDLTWQGAVVTFDGEPIYPSSGNVGLWVMVEYPPSVTVD